MSKNREAKRKAKKKALKAMPAKLEQARAEHVAEAILLHHRGQSRRVHRTVAKHNVHHTALRITEAAVAGTYQQRTSLAVVDVLLLHIIREVLNPLDELRLLADRRRLLSLSIVCHIVVSHILALPFLQKVSNKLVVHSVDLLCSLVLRNVERGEDFVEIVA